MKKIKIASAILGIVLLCLGYLENFSTVAFLLAAGYMCIGIAFLANAFDNQKDKSRKEYYIRILSFILSLFWFALVTTI